MDITEEITYVSFGENDKMDMTAVPVRQGVLENTREISSFGKNPFHLQDCYSLGLVFGSIGFRLILNTRYFPDSAHLPFSFAPLPQSIASKM